LLQVKRVIGLIATMNFFEALLTGFLRSSTYGSKTHTRVGRDGLAATHYSSHLNGPRERGRSSRASLLEVLGSFVSQFVAFAGAFLKIFLIFQVILSFSAAIYVAFYWWAMPTEQYEFTLFFDYGMRGTEHVVCIHVQIRWSNLCTDQMSNVDVLLLLMPPLILQSHFSPEHLPDKCQI
jgi:hypothetical protein